MSIIVDPRLHVDDAGVVDEGGQPPERDVAGLEETLDLGLDPDVGGHGNGRPAGRMDVAHDALGRFAVGAVVHADGVAARAPPAGQSRRRCRGLRR